MSTVRLVRRLDAPRVAVHRALVDAQAAGRWMCPPGMTSQVHAFDARAAAGAQGKTSGETW